MCQGLFAATLGTISAITNEREKKSLVKGLLIRGLSDLPCNVEATFFMQFRK